MICYTSWLEDNSLKLLVGWSMIALISLMLLINLSLILYDVLISIRNCIIRYYRRLARWFVRKCIGVIPE